MSMHDPRLAALLSGVPATTLAEAPGLARLLTSLMVPARPEPAAPEPTLDGLLQQARQDGEAAGRRAGEAAGRAAATAELAPVKAAFAAAAAAASAAGQIDEARLAPLLRQMVKAIAEQVLIQELSAGSRVLEPLVNAVLAEVSDAALAQLSAHPDTLALIIDDLPPGLGAIPDPALPPGHVVVAGPDYRIEAGLAERLARLVEAL